MRGREPTGGFRIPPPSIRLPHGFPLPESTCKKSNVEKDSSRRTLHLGTLLDQSVRYMMLQLPPLHRKYFLLKRFALQRRIKLFQSSQDKTPRTRKRASNRVDSAICDAVAQRVAEGPRHNNIFLCQVLPI